MKNKNVVLTSPLAGGARRTGKSEGYIKENNLIIFPSSVCADSVRQTTSPALGGSHTANSGFTLIELLVVVLIIGILAAVALPQYQKAVIKSRYATLKNITRSIADAEEVYYLANGKYTSKFDELDIDLTGEVSSHPEMRDPMPSVRCTLDGDGIVYCQNNKIKLRYQLSLAQRSGGAKTGCVTIGDQANSLEDRICKAETGDTSPTVTPGTYRHYQYK